MGRTSASPSVSISAASTPSSDVPDINPIASIAPYPLASTPIHAGIARACRPDFAHHLEKRRVLAYVRAYPMATKLPTPPRVGMVSLGCPKNLVDSERILTQLRADGYQMSPDYAGADVVLVNTCGFLDSAKEESLEAIGEAIKENGRVIVTGCMGKEAEAIRTRFPDVLAITGAHEYEQVVEAVHAAAPANLSPYIDLIPDAGLKLTPRHYSYLKISEGCNHRCSFCIIPSLRGDLVSRRPDAILREAEKLVAAGTRELLVISQDTSAYGIDIRKEPRMWKGQEIVPHMTDLARELGKIAPWVRLHYVYPYPHVDQVIPLMAEGLVLPYLDIPFQHAAPSVLKRMKRPGNDAKVLQRIHQWRDICPDIAIRSTFVVGFPARRRRISNICSTGWMKPSSTASVPSASSRSRVPPPMPCPITSPRR
ncbi:hypothetical protein GCM10020258_47340 [Sphingomonas yabuuchiae]